MKDKSLNAKKNYAETIRSYEADISAITEELEQLGIEITRGIQRDVAHPLDDRYFEAEPVRSVAQV